MSFLDQAKEPQTEEVVEYEEDEEVVEKKPRAEKPKSDIEKQIKSVQKKINKGKKKSDDVSESLDPNMLSAMISSMVDAKMPKKKKPKKPESSGESSEEEKPKKTRSKKKEPDYKSMASEIETLKKMFILNMMNQEKPKKKKVVKKVGKKEPAAHTEVDMRKEAMRKMLSGAD